MILPPSEAALDQAIAALQQGALLGLPTETVYGLAADAGQDAAVAAIFQRKGRPAGHPLIVHVADADAATHFAATLPPFAQQLMQCFWPGPLTLIVPRRPGVAEAAASGYATIGLRCPSHPVARQLLQRGLQATPPVYGVAAPSANRFGRVSPTRAQHVVDEFGADLLVLDGGDCDVGIESTIVDCSRGRPIVLRPGHISTADIAAATGLATGQPDEPANLADAPQAPGTLTAHYAPNACVRLLDAAAIATGLQRLAGAPQQQHGLAVYVRSPLPALPDGFARQLLLQRMPDDPQQAAQELFRVLRDLDAQGAQTVWVESVPPGPAWDGVRDRLQRAAASG